MLADAFHAENYRFWKNRTTVLWSVVFVPVMAVVAGAVSNLVLQANTAKLTTDPQLPPQVAQMVSSQAVNLGDAIQTVAVQAANPILMLFVLIGAATIYAGDYRWETWRLISPRNTRPNLLLGKLAVVTVVSLIALLVMMVSGLVVELIKARLFDRALSFSMGGDDVSRLGLLSLLSWWRIIQFTLLGLLAATVTRSLLAALFVPLVAGIVGGIAPQMLAGLGIMPDSWLSVGINPSGAIETIQGALNPRPGETLPEGLLLKVWVSAAAWTVLPLAGALVWFRRQDLSKE